MKDFDRESVSTSFFLTGNILIPEWLIEGWEKGIYKGELAITTDQMFLLADIYKIPTAYFYLPNPSIWEWIKGVFKKP